MKKLLWLTLCVALMLCLIACGGKVSEAKTHEVESERYTQKEIKAAMDTVKKEFRKNWDGCDLLEIYYAGDEISSAYQDFATRNNADEVIVLYSSFYLEPNGGGGSLNTDFTYRDWNWILVRTDKGKWVHVDHGY